MKHYITNTLYSLLMIAGIIIGAFGADIIKSLADIFIPSILTFIPGLMMTWIGACLLIWKNTDNFDIWENQ